MRIQLSDHFTTGKLLRFVAPSIVMMIFTSVYGVVDGLFVSNFVGKTAFAAVNLIFPLLMILGALGFMIGTGGSALVARTLGEGDSGQAQRYFSMLVYVTIGGGIIFPCWGCCSCAPSPCFWAHRVPCWRTASFTAESCWRARRCSCCKMCSRAFSSQQKSPILAWALPWPRGLPISYWTFCSSPCSAGAWRALPLPRPPASLWAAAYRCCILPGPTAAFCGLEKRSWTAVHC